MAAPAMKVEIPKGIKKEKRSFFQTPVSGLVIALGSMLVVGIAGGFVGYSPLVLVGVTLGAWLAVENGGNDVAKGVAPLVASGQANETVALLYGTVVTVVGSLLSIYLASGVLKLFTSGILNSGAQVTGSIMLAIAVGASLWVALATRYSWPVSTTHAIVGAVVTVGLIAYGSGGIAWSGLISKVVTPLLLSPLISLAIAWMISWVKFPAFFRRSSSWVTCGAINFVRAVNDTPKIVAIAFFATTFSAMQGKETGAALYWLVTIAMSVGGYLKGMSILEMLGRKVARLDTNMSLSSSLTAVGLILSASRIGLPVSTTHVTTTAILGAGMHQGPKAVNWKSVREILLSWVITLPLAGLIAAATYLMVRYVV